MGTMDFRGVRALIVVAATMALLALTAGAVAQSAAAAPKKKAPTAKQFKALQKLTKGLVAKVAALEARTEALQARKTPVAAPTPAPILPTTLPPAGPAGGSLQGTYPNPKLAFSSVGTSEIEDGSIRGMDMTIGSVGALQMIDHSIGAADMGPASVTGSTLGSVFSVAGQGVHMTAAEGTKRAVVTCPLGSRLLSGGYEWDAKDNANNTVLASSPIFPSPSAPEDPARTWQIFARIGIGNPNTVFAEALCLG
jgi:hypothetical protein